MRTHPMSHIVPSHIVVDSLTLEWFTMHVPPLPAPRLFTPSSVASKGVCMCRRVALRCLILLFIPSLLEGLSAQELKDVPIEIVATLTDYVPRTVTTSHPAHSYTNCSGSTSYYGQFNELTDSGSGTANTTTYCSTTSYPATQETYTTYRRVNYTIAKSQHALFLLSCSQQWVWDRCPAVSVGMKYTLSMGGGSRKRSVWKTVLVGGETGTMVHLQGVTESDHSQLKLVESLALDAMRGENGDRLVEPDGGTAKVHLSSTPSGGEISIDGRYYGNTPSDVTLTVGEHTVKMMMGRIEWSRTIEVTVGELNINAVLEQATASSNLNPKEDPLDGCLSRLTTALDTWKAACTAEHILFAQCRAQVMAAKPALDEMHLQWGEAKGIIEAKKTTKRDTPRECIDAVEQAVESFDEYLSIEDSIFSLYVAVDPKSPKVKSSWEDANAKYKDLVEREDAAIDAFHRVLPHVREFCGD